MRSLVPLFLAASLHAQEPYPVLPNQGQWPDNVQAAVQHGAMTTWLTDRGFTTRVIARSEPIDVSAAADPAAPIPEVNSALIALEFEGASRGECEFGKQLPGSIGFFIGNDQSRWQPAVKRFASLTRRQLWPGVDLVFSTRDGHLAYDLHLAPGVPVETVRMRIETEHPVTVNATGELEIDLEFGSLSHGKLLAWEEAPDGRRHEVPVSFLQQGDGSLRFSVAEHDRVRPLVIDPSLIWSNLLGGSARENPGVRQSLDRDASGKIAISGFTTSLNFPVGSAVGVWDGHITCYESDGNFSWSALIGGAASGVEWIRTCRFDSAGDIFFAGGSSASDFPTTMGAYQDTNFGPLGPNVWGDMVIGRLVQSGSNLSLPWSTLLGGSGADLANGLVLLSGGRVAVGGWSDSTALWTHSGAAQSQSGGTRDAYVAILNPALLGASQVTHASWWGGEETEELGSLVRDQQGNFVVGGQTNSATSYPTTSNAIQQSYQGGNSDGFVLCLDASLSNALYSTLLGGPGLDHASDVAIDPQGRVGIGAYCESGLSAPITFAASAFQPNPSPFVAGDGYAMILDWNLPPAQQLIWGTYLGSYHDEGINGLAIDQAGRVTVVGVVEVLASSVLTLFPTTAWSLQPVPIGGPGGSQGHFDAFVARLDPQRDGVDQLVYSTYLGGNGLETAFDVILDERARPIVTGWTGSTIFTQGVLSHGSTDIFLTKLDLQASFVERIGAASPACTGAFLDLYHRSVPGGFDLTIHASNLTPGALGVVMLGSADVAGTPLLGLGITSHLLLTKPLRVRTALQADAMGSASFRQLVNLLPPIGFTVQTFWLDDCAELVASDAMEF